MTSAEFRTIFWWEWSHRLLGRLVGVAFAVPFVLLLALRKLPSRLTWRCVLLFLLGATQGAVGWWMVESGLEARTSVAPERLATHLGLALLLFSATIWTALESWFGPRRFASLRSPVWAWASSVLLSGVLLQCLLGALVAGNHAGLIDEDWPLMGGQILPDDYWKSGVWVTLAHGASAVQFNHRLLAYALLAGSLAMAISTFLARASTIRPLVIAICLLMLFQVILGVSTLVLTVPIGLSLLHQLTAVILLAATTMLAWQGRRV